MSTATVTLGWGTGAFAGFFRRQRDLYRRYWAWEVVFIAYNVVTVLSIGYLATGLAALGLHTAPGQVRQAQLYLLIGSVMWNYLSMVFWEVAWCIGWEHWEGTIEYTFMAPVRRVTHLLSVCAFSVLYGLARVLVVVVAVALLFDLDLSRSDVAAALTVLAVGTLPLVGVGILTSILSLLSPEKGEQMAFAVQGLLLLVSGVYYPVSVLPLPLQALGALSPMTYILEGMRSALLQGTHAGAMGARLALLAAMGVVLVPFALFCFGRAEHRARRLGLLKRSG